MTDRNSPSLARRSSLPLVPPPYHLPTTTSPKLQHSLSPSGSGSSSRPRVQSGTGAPTSPLLYRDPTFPMRDPPSTSSPGPQFGSGSQTQPIRSAQPSGPASSSASSSSMSRRPSDTSSAPTTPQLGSGQMSTGSRSWRPTPHVPAHLHRRHRQNALMDESGESSEQHRWLSEDEGTGAGPSRLAGRRRRRAHRSSDPRSNQDEDGGGGYGSAGPASSRTVRTDRPTTGRTHRGKPDRIESSFDTTTLTSSNSKRPIVRRAISMEHHSSLPSGSDASNVGAEPPRISDLVPPPTSPVAVARGMGSAAGSTFTTHVAEGPSAPQDRPESAASSIPDFAPGRGGDGIGGADRPSDKDDGSGRAALQARIDRQKETLGKLRRILGCAFCPSIPGQGAPLLHRPITLPCGHTLSADHVSIPAPPKITFDPNLPAHEIYALQQRQHAHRLSLWASVMCPIPSCKRYSATAAITPMNPVTGGSDDDSSSIESTQRRVSSGAQRGEMLASGVTYYPPAPLPTTDYADAQSNVVTEPGSPLLDISVEKIISIVQREMARLDDDAERVTTTTTTAMRNVELHDREDINVDPREGAGDGGDLSPAASDNSASSAALGRAPSKRRRNRLDQEDDQAQHGHPQVPAGTYRRHGGFEKDMLAVLECDVCACLLHEPVTTPCQHSFCSKCLSRSLDHSSRCPVCRQDLPSFAFFQDHAVNRVLLTILKTVFKNEYDDRSAAIERDERDARLDTPIFVCTLAFPGMPTILHVFEPRYRLMIRRCIESANPRFGMVLPNRGGGPPHLQGVMEYGTMLEIQSVQMLPDGRSMVETVGTHRFRLLEKGSLDGYTVGRIEKIEDISPEEEREFELAAVEAARARPPQPRPRPQPIGVPGQPPPQPNAPGNPAAAGPAVIPLEETAHTTADYMGICRSFIDQLRSGSAPWLLQRLNNTYGHMPDDPSEFSYWMALVMPIDEYEKARLLPIRSARLRLKLIVHWIDSLRSSWWFSSGCVVG